MKKETKQLLLIFLILIIAKTILVSFILSPTAFSDGYIYSKMARSFFYDNNLLVHGILTNQYPPLYPIILSTAYFFNDMQLVHFFMKLINVLLSSLIIFPAFLIAKEFLNKKKALLASIIISILPSNFSFSSFLMSENLFYPLFLFSIYFIYKSFTEDKYLWNILAGLFIGLSFLTRTPSIVLIIIPLILIIYLYNKKPIKKNILIFPIAFLTVLPWVIRNLTLFGFNLSSLFGGYRTELTVLTTATIPTFLIWIVWYIGFLALASGIFFFVSSFLIKKSTEKLKLFTLISASAVALVIIVVSNHNINPAILQNLFMWLSGRPMGRYLDVVLPLIIINGFIGFDYFKRGKFNKLLILTSIIILLSSPLALFQLFPINNMSLSWLGVITYGLKILNIDILIASLIILTLISIFIYFLSKLSFKKIIAFFILFFILTSLLNYGITYYNSKTWLNSSQMQLGLWFNNFDPKTSNLLFDERDCGEQISKFNQEAICENSKLFTLMGFWMNDNIKVGDIKDLKNFDYIISKHKLNLESIKESNGIYIYKVR